MKQICQLYLPSFYYTYEKRSLRAITELLEKLKRVGFSGVYLIALWKDGGHDNGFDIVEYAVNPKFGTREDFHNLIKKAYKVGLTVGVDVVPNHVSNQHPLAAECLKGTPGYEDCLYIVTKDEAERLTAAGAPSFFGRLAYSPIYDKHVRTTFADFFQLNLNWNSEKVKDYFRGVFNYLTDLGIDFIRIDCGMMLHEDVSKADPNNPMACMNPKKSVDAIREVAGEIPLFYEWFDPDSSGIFDDMTNCYALDCSFVISHQLNTNWQGHRKLVPLLGGHDQKTLADRTDEWETILNSLDNGGYEYVFLDIQTLIGWRTRDEILPGDRDADVMLKDETTASNPNQRYRGRRPIGPVLDAFYRKFFPGETPPFFETVHI